jgi:hypothetical protein
MREQNYNQNIPERVIVSEEVTFEATLGVYTGQWSDAFTTKVTTIKYSDGTIEVGKQSAWD